MTADEKTGVLVWLVEDDAAQVEFLREDIDAGAAAAGRMVEAVHVVSSESEFRLKLVSAIRAPDLAVVDVMLRWSPPVANIAPPPADVLAEGWYLAGLRCARLLNARFPSSRIVIAS